MPTPCPLPSRRHPRPHLSLSVVATRGHPALPSAIRLDHVRAARLALEHLAGLGLRLVAFLQGQAFSSDARSR